MFCPDHQNRARAFSLAFGKQEGPDSHSAVDQDNQEEAKDTAAGRPPGQDRRKKGSDRRRKGSDRRKKGSERPKEAPERDEESDPERFLIASLLQNRFSEVRKRLAEQTDGNRWPLISFYVLDNELHARNYYAIIPTGDGNPNNSATLELNAIFLEEAMSPDGALFAAIARQVGRHREALTKGDVQTLDVHFLTYAGVVAINRHPQSGKDENLVCFDCDGIGLSEAPIDHIRQRLRHQRW